MLRAIIKIQAANRTGAARYVTRHAAREYIVAVTHVSTCRRVILHNAKKPV